MITYVESNFILEIALMRDDYRSCKEILQHSRSGTIELVIPAFCIGEPYEAWVRRSRSRRDLHADLLKEARELSRSKPYRALPTDSQSIITLLIDSIESEKSRLDQALKSIVDSAEVIPIDSQTIAAAIEAQGALGLAPQDSIVYASVEAHARRAKPGMKCFINKNSKDFQTPDIQERLGQFCCKMLPTFSVGLEYIESQLHLGV